MTILRKQQQDTYFKLVQELPLVSLKSEVQLAAAQEMIDRLSDRQDLDGGERAYLEAICDLVVVYEDRYHALPMASDADLLRHLMEAKGVTQIQLHKETGLAKSGISEVLAGKKPFSRTMIGTLATYFHVPTSVLAANIGQESGC